MLTIAFFTSRKQPKIEWFFDSLHRETEGDYSGISVLVVDLWAQKMAGHDVKDAIDRIEVIRSKFKGPQLSLRHGAPKPTVWQGEHRLTKVDWFAASNARNTAVCLAPDGWIAYVDDLSVLRPGWLSEVRKAMAGDPMMVTCGAYQKVRDLVVENGEVVSCTSFDGGIDNRLKHVGGEGPHACGGNWMYGCSLIAPVEAFLSIGGWPEALCDGMGFEDCIAGLMLEKRGYRFQYNPAMMTFESDELHAQLPVMRREDYGISPNDKSHAVLRIAQNGDGHHPNYFGDEGIRGLRKRVLAGEPFPVMKIPDREFFTGTLLSEL